MAMVYFSSTCSLVNAIMVRPKEVTLWGKVNIITDSLLYICKAGEEASWEAENSVREEKIYVTLWGKVTIISLICTCKAGEEAT